MRWLALNITMVEESYNREIYVTDLINEKGEYEQATTVILRKKFSR